MFGGSRGASQHVVGLVRPRAVLCRRSAGVSQPSVLCGRPLSSAATALRCSRLWADRPVALGEVLPEPAVEVLVGAALPGTGRGAEVDRTAS